MATTHTTEGYTQAETARMTDKTWIVYKNADGVPQCFDSALAADQRFDAVVTRFETELEARKEHYRRLTALTKVLRADYNAATNEQRKALRRLKELRKETTSA